MLDVCSLSTDVKADEHGVGKVTSQHAFRECRGLLTRIRGYGVHDIGHQFLKDMQKQAI